MSDQLSKVDLNLAHVLQGLHDVLYSGDWSLPDDTQQQLEGIYEDGKNRIESAAAPVEVDSLTVDVSNVSAAEATALSNADFANFLRYLAGGELHGSSYQTAFAEAANRIATLARQLAEANSELSGLRASRIAYASEFPLNADGEPDTGSIHANIRAMKSQLAEATRRVAEVERSARVNESLERAAEELPSGWLVTVIVEKHAGWVELTDPHGNTDPIDDDEGSLATAVHTAIDIALTKEPTK